MPRGEKQTDYINADVVLRITMKLPRGRTTWFENLHGRVVQKYGQRYRVFLYKDSMILGAEMVHQKFSEMINWTAIRNTWFTFHQSRKSQLMVCWK